MEKTPRAATGRDSEKYIVRFPDGMRDRIAEAAKASGRSMNAEIVARVEKSFRQPSATEVIDVLVELRHDLAEAELDRQVLVLMVREMALYVQALGHTLLKTIDERLSDEVRNKIAEWSRDAESMKTKAVSMLHTDLAGAVGKFEETAKTLTKRIEQARAQAKLMMPVSTEASSSSDTAPIPPPLHIEKLSKPGRKPPAK